jgi:carbonic anhydrase
MDGRIQKPVLEYLEKKFPGYYPDTVTEPGPVRIIANKGYSLLNTSIMERVNISLNKHNAEAIFIVAHPDCAGNPVSKKRQLEQLEKAKKRVRAFHKDIPVYGLWVENNREVEEI